MAVRDRRREIQLGDSFNTKPRRASTELFQPHQVCRIARKETLRARRDVAKMSP
jgi:hypothetical protein